MLSLGAVFVGETDYHTQYPKTLLKQISTRPSFIRFPPTSLTCPVVQGAAMHFGMATAI